MNNKLLFDYGPIWSKKNHDNRYMSSRMFLPPDAVTCGQMVYQDFFSCNEVEGSSENEPVKHGKPEVKTRKYVSKKFPLRFDICAKPLLNQSYEYQIFDDIDKSYLNILSSFESNNVNHIVYGEYEKDSFVLKMSSLKEINDEKKCEIVLDNVQCISEYSVLRQSQAEIINGIPYILLLVDNTISLLRVKEDGFNLCSFESKGSSCSCMSRDLSNCFAFTEEAIISLFDVDREKLSWKCHLDQIKFKGEKYIQCEFGINPFHICVSCESEVILVDTRIQERNNQRILFDVKNFNRYLYSDDETICSFRHSKEFPFFYVACSDTLLLMDERFCKYPVLSWYHMMKGRPSYTQCFKNDDIDFVLMADPNKSQFCFTSLQSDNLEYPNLLALSTPIHKNIAKDTLMFTKRNEISLSDLSERQICSQLIGLSILPCSIGKTIIFQNNFGTLFYFNCFDRKNKLISESEETAIKPLKIFEKVENKKLRKNHMKKFTKAKYVDGLKFAGCFRYLNQTIKKGGSNYNKLIWDINSFRSFCYYSKFFSENEVDKNEDLSCCDAKDRYNLSADYIKNCSDSLSQTLLSVWSTDFSDFSSIEVKYSGSNDIIPYHSCPYFLNIKNVGEIPLLSKEVNTKPREPTNEISNNEGNDISSINNFGISDINIMNIGEISDVSMNKGVCLSDKKKKRKLKMDGF